MGNPWKESIMQQRISLAKMLAEPLSGIAVQCATEWGKRKELDVILSTCFHRIPHCTFLYVLDTNGIQISDNISIGGILPEHYGRDRSDRPYMKEVVPAEGFLLSDAYISLMAKRPSITALQIIKRDNETLGFLGADFDLRDLPMTAPLYDESKQWRQIKGDPAIRGTVFQQRRAESLLDRNIDQANSILTDLIMERGMFQGVLHFSSSRATIWVIDDPFRYRILDHEALSDPDICLAYPHHAYPKDAVIPKDSISSIFESMKKLRMLDETIYLRGASINTFNGMISLTFSCDGTHYMLYNEFLERDVSFWVGSAA